MTQANPPAVPAAVPDFVLERYKFLLQQIHAINTTVYTFLAIYQTLTTLLVTGGVTLFVSYKDLSLSVDTVRAAVLCVLLSVTVIALFTCLLIVIGVLSWMDYRREEVELADKYFSVGFRSRPRARNFWRWYETYIIAFILVTVATLWVMGFSVVFPAVQ